MVCSCGGVGEYRKRNADRVVRCKGTAVSVSWDTATAICLVVWNKVYVVPCSDTMIAGKTYVVWSVVQHMNAE